MQAEKCDHCGESITVLYKDTIQDKELHFCCQGCKTVAKIIRDNQLEDFYQLRANETQSISQRKKKKESFLYINDEAFKNEFAILKDETLSLDFYLENVHCVACLWILEKLPKLNSDIILSNLNMSDSLLSLTVKNNADLAEIATLISDLGYPPHPILEKEDSKKLREKENRKEIIRIAVSFFCMGNIMLFAFSNYLGAENNIKDFFDYLSGLLFLPILFHGALPFYKNSLGALKSRSLSIDFPIVIALLLGSFLSYFSLFSESIDHVYFDTLAVLVFLLLSSRYLLKMAQQKSLQQNHALGFLANLPARQILADGTEKEVFSQFIEKDHLIKVLPNETIPLDGLIQKGSSFLNNALLTGEVKPIPVTIGDQVTAGSVNQSDELIIKVTKDFKNSGLGSILKEVEQGWQAKTNLITFTDKVSQYFVSFQIFLSLLIFVYFYFTLNFEQAYLRSLTLIIITCPCALGLTPPLTFTLSLAKLARKGILVKDEKVLENLEKAQSIFFDKTGTLTQGDFSITQWKSLGDLKEEFQITYALEAYSKHPIAKSVREYIQHQIGTPPKLPLHSVQSLANGSIEGEDNQNNQYKIQPLAAETTAFEVLKNNQTIAQVFLEDKLIPNVQSVLEQLIKQFKLFLISGDNKESVESVGLKLNFLPEHIFSRLSPQEKSELIRKNQPCIMVGDGANDAIAINQANVGISVSNSLDLAMRASNVYFSQRNTPKALIQLIIVAQETIKVLKRNVSFSVLYNVIGVVLAVSGQITPLVAAILMPISSATVLLSSLYSTNSMRKILN